MFPFVLFGLAAAVFLLSRETSAAPAPSPNPPPAPPPGKKDVPGKDVTPLPAGEAPIRDKFGKTTTGDESAPRKGIATHPEFTWFRVIKKAKTAPEIATIILGSTLGPVRYVELYLANPDLATPDGGFKKPLQEGDFIMLPRTWNPWIDQLGYERGETIPFPAA